MANKYWCDKCLDVVIDPNHAHCSGYRPEIVSEDEAVRLLHEYHPERFVEEQRP